MSLNTKNYYCSQKFTYLSVDIEKKLLHSCCAATPEKIDVSWIKFNPGKLFNTDNLQQERQDMLNNIPVTSCKTACWDPEAQGLASRRTKLQTYTVSHSEVDNCEPQSLNIVLGSTCNLTCSYCSKQYSTAWARDIENNGIYFNDNRFILNQVDAVLSRISQKELEQTDSYLTILKELSCYKNLNQVFITGGEPLLYNSFPDLINNIKISGSLIFYTGLGVNNKRLYNQLELIKNTKNISAVVSAENCEHFYEFNRYSNTWDLFLKNLETLKIYFPVRFSSTVSNLTLYGLNDFVNKFGDENIIYNFCNEPDYLRVNVLDDQSKQTLKHTLEQSQISLKDSIISSMMQPCSDLQRQNFSHYLVEFARRRNLSLDIYPSNLLKWLNIK